MEAGISTNHKLLQELDYYKKQLDEMSIVNIGDSYTISELKNELRQKVQAFSVLAALQQTCTVETPINEIYSRVVQALCKDLVMDKVLLLTPAMIPGGYKPNSWAGFSSEETPVIEMREIAFSSSTFSNKNYLLHNSKSSFTEDSDLINWSFKLPFFIAVPVMIDKMIVAILLAGRIRELKPIHLPLNEHDAETLIAISGMIATFLQNKRVVEFKMRIEQQLRDKNEIMNKFSQQVSKNVAEELVRKNVEYKSEKREVCIMFLDIRNFTPFAENKEPEEVVHYLNTLFDFMISIIDRHNGIVNQFLGDGFMTTFGAPVIAGNPCQNAVDAACEILEALHQKNQDSEHKTTVGIGIHKGNAITGNIGSSLRRQFSITGNVVILASRIEQLTKQYAAQILISSEVYNSIDLKGKTTESIGPVSIKGRSLPVELFKIR
ncbi:MAG: Adenylate cyclase [Segetibacter sp.]|nr:Adenylate cyclase [Segetibacter sp.]